MHTPAKLLRAASAMVGGEKALAERLGIDDALLAKLMTGEHELPEPVLLGTVDIIMAKHESKRSFISKSDVQGGMETSNG